MRAATASSLIGLGASAFFLLALGGCPPSFYEPCRGLECGLDDGGGEVGDEVRPDVPPTPKPPKIDEVVVDGNPSRTIRQGFGGDPTNGTTVVHLTGERLDEVTDVTIGNGANALKGVITEQTPRALSFTVKVIHGAPLGQQAVNVTAPSGSAMSEPVFVISRITASPTGTDSLERGSATGGTDAQPLRSMGKAITFAAAGDTVFLKNGTYDVANGETKVPPGVTLQGESQGGTLLKWNRNGGGLVVTGNGHIESLGMIGAGITASGAVLIKDVTISEAYYGLDLQPGVTVDSVDVSEATVAINITGENGTLTLNNSRVHNNRSGIDAQISDATLVVTNTKVYYNCPGTLNRIDGGIIVKGPAILTNVDIHDNRCSGITMDSQLTGPLVITGGTFVANFPNSIALNSPGKTKIRAASFGYHEREVIGISSEADLDLGTPEDPGNNLFARCDGCDTILNWRAADGVNPITVTGNKWNQAADEGEQPPFGCSNTDEPKGTSAPPRTWHIAAPGTCNPIKGNVMVNVPPP
ncbi:DUF1565 domain-containing protein [Pendulispora brunnea]|uniref:DUF1565 domain-containing protein n=1 Tax=Pendulispora brunnea TaxID=2905690 RepID=A0ABZ2KCV1_9BACT